MGKLVVLLVTTEQEASIQTLYSQHGWKFLNFGLKFSNVQKDEIFKYIDSCTLCPDKVSDDATEKSRAGAWIAFKDRKGEITNKKDQKSSIRRGSNIKPRSCELGKNKRRLLRQTRNSDLEKSSTISDRRKNLRLKNNVKDNDATISKIRNQSDGKEGNKKSIDTIKRSVPVKSDKLDDKNNLKYTCTQCPYSTNNNSNYLRHLREVHITARHPCSKCNKTFKSKHEAKSHLMCAHIKGLQCGKCGRHFTSRGGLFNHTKHIHEKKVLYKCDICDASFFYKQHFIGHMNRHSSTKPYTCTVCSKTFVYKTTWTIHKKSCQGGKAVNDGASSVNKDKVLCDICGEELSNRSVLKTHHRLVHSDEPKSTCSECGKSFKGMYSLKRHIHNAHTEAKNLSLPCEICGKSFNQVQILREHVKRHKKEFSAYCQTCGKGFYSNFKLKEHERTHTGEKPFSCPLCPNFKCASKYNLASHLKTHKNGRKIKEKKPKTDKDVNNRERKGNKNADSEIQTSYQNGGQGHSTRASMDEDVTMVTKDKQVMENYPIHTVGQLMTGTTHLINHPQQMSHDQNSHLLGMDSSAHVQYEHSQYHPEMSMNSSDVIGYSHRVEEDSYYGNTSSAVAQGLNILTVAMNMVDHNPY